MDWLALSLISAFALASADAATKAWLQGLTAWELALVRFTLTGVLLLPLLWGLPAPGALPWPFWGWLALMVPLEIAAMLLYMAAIRDHPLSLTLPYLAFTPAFILVVGWLLLGERIPATGASGVLFVVLGAWLLNAGHARGSDWRSWATPLAAIFWEPGSRMMLAVALIFAFTAVMGKAAIAYLPPVQFGAFYFLFIGLVLPIALLPLAGRKGSALRGLLRHLRRRPFAMLTVAGLNAVMILTHFTAIERVEVAYMIAVKRTSLLFGILYGALLFHEPGLRRRLPAGALMLVGVLVILLA